MTNHRRLCRTASRTLGLLLVTLTSAASAQESIQPNPDSVEAKRIRAEAAFWEGKRYYESGAYDQALLEFQAAYGLVGDPDLLYDIAQAYRQKGNCSLALESYQQFLKSNPNSQRASLVERQVALLKSSCMPAVVVPAPAPSQAVPTRIPGHSVSSHPTPTKPRIIVGPSKAPLPEQGTERGLSHWAIASLVAGLAAGGIAVGLEVVNENRYQSWKERDRELDHGTLRGETPVQWLARQRDNDALLQSVRNMDYVAVGLGVGAGVLLTIPSVLYITSGNSKSRPDPERKLGHGLQLVPVGIGTNTATLAVRGQF